MDERLRAEIKDRFLGYSIDRPDYFMVSDFKKGHPDLINDEDELIAIVQEIIDFDPNLLDNLSGNGTNIFLVCSKPKAKDFLNQGGFSDIYENEEMEWNLLFKRLLHINMDKVGKNVTHKQKLYKKDVSYYIFVIISILSFCYCLMDIIGKIIN